MRYTQVLVRLNPDGSPLMGCCLAIAALFVLGLFLPGPAVCSAILDEPTAPFRIGGNPVHSQGASVRGTPDAAFDGTNYLTVWADARNGSDDVYGARVSPSGVVLDPEGIAISIGPSRKQSPSVAFDGTNYLVVWADERNGSWDIYATRVTPRGNVMNPGGIAVSTAQGTQLYPSIASNGSQYLVVWHDERTGYVDVRGARLSGSGTVFDKTGFVIASGIAPEEPPGPGGIAGPDGPWGPKVESDGTGFFVVWQSGWDELWDVFASRVTSSGTVVDDPPIAVTTTEQPDWYPDVTFGGQDYLVVWHTVEGSFDVFGARVSTSGTVLDPDPIFISERRNWQRFPTAAYDGTNFLVAWANWTHSAQDVYVARVDPSGTVLDPTGAVAISAHVNVQWRPSIAFDGTNYLILCQDSRSTSGANIHGALINRSGEVITPRDIEVSPKGYGPWGSEVAFGGTDFMFVWSDIEGGMGNVFGARVSGEEVLLDDDAIPVSEFPGRQVGPAIAFDGVNYMVVWQDGRSGSWDIYGARMNRSGYVFDLEGLPITSFTGNEMFPAIAFDGSNYMVVWQDRRAASSDIYGMRLTPSGASLDPAGILLSAGDSAQRHPAIAFDGTNYLVVWEDYRSGSGDIYGLRVTRDGSVLDPGGFLISAESEDEWDPAVSCDGGNSLVVWQTWNDGAGDIRGARVSPSGVVADPQGITVSAGSGRQWKPDAVFNGTYHIVTWGDARNGRRNVDLYAARVSTLGGVIDPDGIGISTDSDSQVLPAAASDDTGRLLIAHSWLRPPSIFGYWRIWCVGWDPPEELPLQLTLGIHQNPELTSELDVYLVPSKAVQDTSVYIAVNGVSVKVTATDTKGSIYRGGYRLTTSGPHLITSRARDLAGVLTEANRSFGAGLITASDGGHVAGPGGLVSLWCPRGSFTRDVYVLIDSTLNGDSFLDGPWEPVGMPSSPNSELDRSLSHEAVSILLSPPSLVLENPAILAVDLFGIEDMSRGRPAAGSELWPSLWREGPHGWEHAESEYNEDTRTLTAYTRNLGRFKVVWSPIDKRGGTDEILLRNVPNPFRSVVDVKYYVPRGGPVNVSVYDVGGRLVKTLFEGSRGPGWWTESWDGRDTGGGRLPSGIYFTDVRSGGTNVSRKCVLVR